MSSQTPFIKEHYEKKVAPALQEKLGYKNKLEIPRIEKVVLNMGVSALLDKSAMEEAVKNMGLVTGQKPIIRNARTSISNFKLREGMPVGCKVTLRGERMWDFLFRLIAVALPSIRDFRGIHSRLDGNGNYSLGVTDVTIFPEISVESLKRPQGLEFTIVTSAKNDKEGFELLSELGMPFRKKEKKEEVKSSETAA